MKNLLIPIIFLLLIPFSIADISLIPQQHSYNLGNRLKVSASVLSDQDFEGLLKFDLVCDNYHLQYFITPINLEAGFRTAIDVPELQVTPLMLGTCKIESSLTTHEGNLIDEKKSSSFFITRDLKILPIDEYISSLPGKLIRIVGVVTEAFGNNVLNGTINAKLENSTYNSVVLDGKFEITILLQDNIKSGSHIIELFAQDQKINAGFANLELSVIAIPTKIEIKLSEFSITPGTTINISASLYDQAGDLVKETLSLTAKSSSGKNIFSKNVNSGEPISYEFNQHLEPGTYSLSAIYKDLADDTEITLNSVNEVKVRYENQQIVVENIGNTPFKDELTLLLQDGSKRVPITKKISINPGEILKVDLSKEVPKGVYDIILPLKNGISTLKEQLQIVFGPDGKSEEVNVVAEHVEIEDNRPVIKKITGRFSSLTGNLIGSEGIITKHPFIAPSVLLVILGLIGFKYGRKPIKALFKSRSDQEKEIREKQTDIGKEPKF